MTTPEQLAQNPKGYALSQLAEMARDQEIKPAERLQAAEAFLHHLEEPRDWPMSSWYNVQLRDLTVFFLKCAVAVLPSIALLFSLYVAAMILNHAATGLLM